MGWEGRGWGSFGLAVREVVVVVVVLKTDGGHVRKGGKGVEQKDRTPVGSLFYSDESNIPLATPASPFDLSHILLRDDICSIMTSS